MIKSYDTQTVGSAMINAIVAQEVKRQRDARVAALESENAELRRKLEIRKRRERQASKAARLLAAGFDAVVTDQDNVLQSDKKFDKVLDLIGPAALRDTFAHTNGGGIICVTGLLGGQWALTEFDPLEELPADAYLTAFHSGNVSKEKLQAMLRYVAQYGVNATPEKVFRLEEVPQAHEYLAAADSFGKVVVLNDQ